MKDIEKEYEFHAKGYPRKILLSWEGILRKFCRTTDWNLPWAYNERATLSTFTAAAWDAGAVALEEYSTLKKNLTVANRFHKKVRLYMGRCDLYVSFKGRDLAFEAKNEWVTFGKSDKVFEKVKERVGVSKLDIKKVRRREADERYALCFVTPCFDRGRNENVEVEEVIEFKDDFIAMAERLHVDAWAIYLPHRALDKLFDNTVKAGKRRWFPGVGVLLKRSQHKSK